MSIVRAALLATAGIYLAMRWLASLYLLIDLRYTWRTAWPRMARALTIWTLVPAAFVIMLREDARAAFLWGFGGYIVFYVLVALFLSEILIPRLITRRN